MKNSRKINRAGNKRWDANMATADFIFFLTYCHYTFFLKGKSFQQIFIMQIQVLYAKTSENKLN